jgi:DnaK suppressor protein
MPAKKPQSTQSTPKKASPKKSAAAPQTEAAKKSTPVKTKTTATTKTKKTMTTEVTKPKAAPATKKAPAKATAKPAVSTQSSLMGIAPYQLGASEEYMNEKQRLHFTNLLQAWKRQLMEEVDRTLLHMQNEAANFPDPSDRASQEEEFSLELRARDRERKLIRKIESTLQSIKDDEYGYCETCGVEIGIRRLEARPTATLCIDCKTAAEIKEKQEVG